MPTSKLKLLDDPTLSDADWSTNPPLSAEVFISTVTYDALNRPLTSTDPGGNSNEYTYDRGGVLKTVKLNTDIYIADLHYDAKGQRSAIWYGNGTKTSYTYDPLTFRLRRLLTVKLSTNEILQDLHYWYDPVGKITEIQDDAQQTLFFNNSVVTPTQEFTYDALYRLMEAKGRELIGTASFGAEDNWNDAAWQTTHKGDGNALQNYTQLYTYDEIGNILQLRHVAGIGSYTRDYTIDSGSNRMEETEVGVNTYAYDYDLRGNMLEMPHLDGMKWNATNELYFIKRGSNLTSYQYSGGQRIRKYTDKGIVKEERIYLGSFEIYRKFEGSSLKIERQTVHVNDDSGRIAMLEKRTFGTDPSPASLLRYIYSNHLQSASLELDDNADIISYEEYHPYGTTSYQAMNAAINAVAKRYRYTGKERDDESGLYYHGARYYIPWLARWTAVDPLESKYAGMSPYNYSFNNPVMYNDPSGMEGRWFTYKKPDDETTYHVHGESIEEIQNRDEKYKSYKFTGDSYITRDFINAFNKNERVYLWADGTYTITNEIEEKRQRELFNFEQRESYINFFYFVPNENGDNPYELKLEQVKTSQWHMFIGEYGTAIDPSLILGTDGNFHLMPLGWQNQSLLNAAGSYEHLFEVINTWENGNAYYTGMQVKGFMEELGNTAALGFGAGGITSAFTGRVKINLASNSGLKPLGLGSTGRTTATNINEELAMKEIMSNPSMGNIVNLKKGMTDPRWPKEAGWKKMSWNNGGVEIHYLGRWENGVLKAVDDFKFIGGK